MINLDVSFIFQIVNFLLLLLLLNVVLYKPIRRILAERKAKIDGDRERAAAVDREVQEKMALYEANLREAKAKAGDERTALRKEAGVEEAALLEKARGEAAGTLASLKEGIAREATVAKALLTEQAQSLSREIFEKVLGRSV